MSKRHRANLKRLLVAKYRTVWTSEQIMCLELKPINYKISKSILTLLTLLNLNIYICWGVLLYSRMSINKHGRNDGNKN
jgi:hypothetical protein